MQKMQDTEDATLDLGGHSNLEKVSNLLKVTLPSTDLAQSQVKTKTLILQKWTKTWTTQLLHQLM